MVSTIYKYVSYINCIKEKKCRTCSHVPYLLLIHVIIGTAMAAEVEWKCFCLIEIFPRVCGTQLLAVCIPKHELLSGRSKTLPGR